MFVDFGCYGVDVFVDGCGCWQVCVGKGDGDECDRIAEPLVGVIRRSDGPTGELCRASCDRNKQSFPGVDGIERDLVRVPNIVHLSVVEVFGTANYCG